MVSISCITYNHQKFIGEAIEGFLMQKTDFAIEILIYDDASTDGTADIVREYEKQHPELIKPIYQRINQYSQVRRISAIFVWPNCSGKYIALCDGDDYWTDPLKLQKQVDFLENHEYCAGTFHETQSLYEEDKSVGKIYGKDVPNKLYTIDTISTLAPFHTSSFVFRKSALEKPELNSNIFSGDMATFSMISKSGYLQKIPGTMSVYRKHAGGITSSIFAINSYHQGRIELAQYLDKYHDYKYSTKVKDVIEYHRNEMYKKLHPSLLEKIRVKIQLRNKLTPLLKRIGLTK